MASQLLIEGVLDIKDPRGSEDRKFWKVWRRQWIRFSVVYPGGRREPYLLLSMFRSASETPEKETKLARDGLRLFRCRSKSRPYRTWAITSGNKMVLYFAAKSEIQAQNWMQAVRDGLWPPCFSFQVVTACNYEVSLIDDDNTFLSGLLGVYGRFVLTSDDVMSLMHPHWGSTLMEISLDNIKDVHFIREAEVSPAGVFGIVLKRVEGSKIKALQFFCNTAKDAIQWILSKLYARRKSLLSDENRIIVRKKTSNSFLDDFISPNTNQRINAEKEKMTLTAENQLIFTQINTIVDKAAPKYKKLQYLNIHTAVSNEQSPQINKDLANHGVNGGDLETPSEQILLRQSKAYDSLIDSKNVDEHGLSDLKSDENIYENVITGADIPTTTLLSISDGLRNLIDTSRNYPNEKLVQTDKVVSEMPLNDTAPCSVEYAIVSKSNILKDSYHQISNISSQTNQPSENKNNNAVDNNIFKDIQSSDIPYNCKNRKKNSFSDSNECYDIPSLRFDLDRMEQLSTTKDTHGLSDRKAKENTYVNMKNGTTINTMTSHNFSHNCVDINNLSNEYSNTKFSHIKTSEPASVITQMPLNGAISYGSEYATVNKSNILKNTHQILNEQFSANQSTNERTSYGNVADNGEISERTSSTNHYITMSPSNASHRHLYDTVGMTDNNTSTHSKILQQNKKVSVDSSNADNTFNKDNLHLIPNLPSNILDTSLNSLNLRYKTSESSSSEEDCENLQWLINEFDNLGTEDRIYEDILDRKGTTYEEIDASDDETERKLSNAPQLPKRPENLEIPDSLRLQKLSKNINQTLQVAEDTQLLTKEHPRQSFIKKIKDVNRIMQISPNQEHTKEAFTVELKLPIDAKDLSVLTPSSGKSTKPR